METSNVFDVVVFVVFDVVVFVVFVFVFVFVLVVVVVVVAVVVVVVVVAYVCFSKQTWGYMWQLWFKLIVAILL